MFGLFTRLAAFLASGEMAVAFWCTSTPVINIARNGPDAAGVSPHEQRGVDAVAFCFAFLYICSRGPGIWSFDTVMTFQETGLQTLR